MIKHTFLPNRSGLIRLMLRFIIYNVSRPNLVILMFRVEPIIVQNALDYIYINIDRCGLAIYKINRCAPRNGLSLDKPEGTEGLSTFRARGR